jgi:8-oxo-dGTP pyrophosphatase MutT (NUDIX family)
MIKTFKQFIKESIDWSNSVTAVIALFNQEGQLLALKRGMTAPWKPGYWNITGGVVGDTIANESPKDAAIREAIEESGLTPTNIQEWGMIDTKGSPEACGLIYYFTGDVNEDPSASDEENSEWEFIDKENLDKVDWVPFLTDFDKCDLSKAKFKNSFLHEVWK